MPRLAPPDPALGEHLPPGVAVTHVVAESYLRIDHFTAGGHDKLAFCFTARESFDPHGPGPGGKFLFKNGFDVIAIKIGVNNWFAGINAGHIAAIERCLSESGRRYAMRVAFGASMGAHGVFRFSKSLSLDRVFAMAPLYDITLPWETRWRDDHALLPAGPMMHRDFIAPDCACFIAFDPHEADAPHVRLYQDIIAPDRLILLPTRHTGHETARFLHEIGALGGLTRAFLDTGTLDPAALRFTGRHRSRAFLSGFAESCLKRGHLRWALAMNARARALTPEEPTLPLLRQQATILAFMRDFDPAIDILAAAAIRYEEPNVAVEAARLRAHRAEHLGDWEAAAERWAELRALRPRQGEGYTAGLQALRRLGRVAEMDALAEQAAARFPGDPALAVAAARAALRRDDRPEAERRCAALRARFPDSPEGFLIGARLARQAGRPDDAESLAAEAVRHFPARAEAAIEHARAALARRDWATAAQRAADGRDAFPDEQEFYLLAIRAFRQAGRQAEAGALATNMAARFPKS